jgi:flagellar biosynthesis protein FlhG
MSALTPAHHVGIINAFSDLGLELDLLLIDNASGIGEGVLRFADAAHEVLLLVCDEPASIIGAYSLIKLLRAELGVSRFRVITNMTQPHSDGSGVFQKLFRLSDRFLDATLDHAGNVPFDDHVRRAAQLQTPLVTAFPSSPAAKALQALAGRVDDWAMPLLPRGNIEFFVERLLRPDCVRQGPALT